MRWVWLPVVVAMVLVSEASRACDGAEKPPQFLTAGPLPTNAGGVLWWNGRWATVVDCGAAPDCQPKLPDPKGWRIERIEGDEATAVPHRVEPVLTWRDRTGALRTDTFLLSAEGGFEAGGRYRFRAPEQTKPIDLEVSHERLDSAEATLSMREQGSGPVRGSGKQSAMGVVRLLSMTLPKAVEPFEGALAYETMVDGRRWREGKEWCEYPKPDRPIAGRGQERLATFCDYVPKDAVLQPGRRQKVVMRALLPGTDVAFEAVANVLLSCPEKKSSSSTSSRCGGCATPPSRRAPFAWWILAAVGLLRRRGAAAGSGTSRVKLPCP